MYEIHILAGLVTKTAINSYLGLLKFTIVSEMSVLDKHSLINTSPDTVSELKVLCALIRAWAHEVQ